MQEQQIYFCNLCGKSALFFCGNCKEVAYCRTQHQKADWLTHRTKCVSSLQKEKWHIAQRTQIRKQIFMRLAKKQYIICEKLNQAWMVKEDEFLKVFPSKQNEIQYAATVLLHVRLMIMVKDYNRAQDILSNYVTLKRAFIQDLSGIPNKLDEKEQDYQKSRNFVLGKLRIISTLANLTHQLIRNSIEIVELLIKHVQKFFGPQSLQLSNSYFETGMYYHYMNHTNKAVACFLKAGKLRNKKGAIAFYNAAHLLSNNGEDLKALRFFKEALRLSEEDRIQNGQQSDEFQTCVYENLGICHAKLDDIQQMFRCFQHALCIIDKKGQANQHPHFKLILDLLKAIKKEIQADSEFQSKAYSKLMELPHEKPMVKKYANINNNDFDLFWNVDKNMSQGQKESQWKASFGQFRKKLKLQGFGIYPPQVFEKYLKSEKDTQYREQQGRIAKNYDATKDSRLHDKLQIDMQFMTGLSAIQVDYMNQLNNILSQSKQKTVTFEVVEASNFSKSLTPQQKILFFKLNPRLEMPVIAKKKHHHLKNNLIDNVLKEGVTVEKFKIKTPKLDLTKLQREF